MRGVSFFLLFATIASSSFSAEQATIRNLKPGDFVQVECRWRNVDVPPTAMACPYVEAADASGRVTYHNRATSLGRRGFEPGDSEVERWQLNYLVDGGAKPPFDAECSFTRLPSNVVSLTASLSKRGDPAVRSNVEITVRREVLKSRGGIGRRPPLEWHGRELTDAELDAALKKREKARMEIFRDGDRTAVRLNGNPFMPSIYKMTQFNPAARGAILAAFTNNGFNVFFAPVYVGGRGTPETNAIWRADGSVDVAQIRDGLRKLLRWNPTANLVLEVIVQAPRGWGEAHPSELYRNERGDYGYWHHHRIRAFGATPEPEPKSNQTSTPSYTSEIWAKAMSDVVGRIVADLENAPEGKAIVGLFLGGGTDEQWLDLFDNGVKPWQMGDYSDVARRRFVEYLREKYGTVAKLNSAYGRTDILSFEEVAIPSTAELTSENIPFFRVHGATVQSDYREFMARVAAEMYLKVAATVKVASGRRLLFGGYAPHGGLSGYPLYAQSASGRLMSSRDMDFFAIVPGYIREFCDPIRSAVFDGSMVRRGKLFVRELDLRSVDSNQFWGRWREPFWQEVHSSGTFRRKAFHYAMDAIVHGGVYHAYDMDGGWFNSPSDQKSWCVVNRAATAARAMPPLAERIALIGGERYCDYYSSQRGRGLAYPLLEYIPKALQRSGVPWNAYLLDDVLYDATAELPKVLLLSDATTMTAADFAKFRSRYCRDGRVVVYFWRPGLFAADGMEIDKALGLKPVPDMADKAIVCSGKSDDSLTSGMNGMFAATYAASYTPEVAVVEEEWKPLLFFDGTKAPGVSVRRGAECTEVYIALPGAITAQFCRNLAREAGFEPLVESDELSGCGSGIFYMVAQSTGEKRFRLPRGCKPSEVLAGSAFKEEGEGVCSVKMQIGEIFVLAYRLGYNAATERNAE